MQDDMGIETQARTVLIVDDDSDIRETLAEYLEDEGYHVWSAANGLEALHCLRSAGAPCLILLDLTMPVMDGMQFRTEQMRDPDLAPIPVVIFTAGGRLEGTALDIPLLHKPVSLEDLMAVIHRYCDPLDP